MNVLDSDSGGGPEFQRAYIMSMEKMTWKVLFLASLLPPLGALSQSSSVAAVPPKTPAQIAQQLRLALATSTLNPPGSPLGDYVQCEFTVAELFELRLSPNAVTLTDADGEVLKRTVIQTALSLDYADALTQGATDAFIALIDREPFAGLTQSQALVKIMLDFSAAKGSSKAADSLARVLATIGVPADIQAAIGNTSNIPEISEILDERLHAAERSTNPEVTKDKERIQQAQKMVKTADAKQTAQQAQIINTSRQTINVFLRPTDVGCAMSMLDYNETKQAYGGLVAKEYIAIQLVVRNLNLSQEFQVHDAEFAVDADPSGRHSRFYSGRDKLIVRTFSVAQQNFDIRNLWVHGAQGVGSILNSIVPVYGGSFATAVGVFSGGAVPALDKFWRDPSTDQLNLLNDTGFSSSVNARTIVPKSGVAMFVIFVPSSTFESGWWTQECANKIYLGSTDKVGKVIPAGQASGKTGIDVDRALEPCLSSGIETTAGNETFSIDRAAQKTQPEIDVFSNSEALAFKKWTGSMFQIFRELSFTVVSGAHTFDESQLIPSVSAVNCKKDAAGNVVFDGKDILSCPASGANLGSIAKLRLRNTTDPKDSVDGSLTVQGDPTSGTVSFPEAALEALTGSAYSVFMVDNADIETSTAVTMHFATSPTAVSGAPSSIDLSKDLPATIKIAGVHLKGIGAITLTSIDGKVTDTFNVSGPTDTLLSITITKTSKVATADATKGISFVVSLQPAESGAKAIETKLTLEAKGKIATAGALPPKAVQPKKPPKKPAN